MQCALANDPGPASLTATDRAHRLARYLTHATKTGVTPGERRDLLLELEVDARHPHAAPVKVRRPYARGAEVVYVDTNRLPADHGRVDRSPAAPLAQVAPNLLSELQAAHRLLMLALGCMTTQQQATFAQKSQSAGLGTDGATRHHERAAVIAQATGRAS